MRSMRLRFRVSWLGCFAVIIDGMTAPRVQHAPPAPRANGGYFRSQLPRVVYPDKKPGRPFVQAIDGPPLSILVDRISVTIGR